MAVDKGLKSVRVKHCVIIKCVPVSKLMCDVIPSVIIVINVIVNNVKL